ncbi:MAG TPA: T9SS type A sorting domain-containing protein, partial [Chitinophaga sp.]|nr:T9SS type A sorting domain-containing protein [Chitinophaga sp.]
KFDNTPVDVSKRVSWSKQLNDTEAAAYYDNTNLFGTWDPFMAFPAINAPVRTALAVANFRAKRSSSNSTLSWNICWPMSGVKYELFRSRDSVNFTKIGEVTGAADSVVAFSLTDTLPVKGTIYYYYVRASKSGYPSTDSYVAIVDPSVPLNGDYRSKASGSWTNAGSTSIWERYNGTTKVWEEVAVGTGASGNVTISAGDTVSLNSLVGINNLTVDSGGVFQTDGQSRNFRVKGDVNNAGIFGGTDPAVNKITLELDGTNGIYNISGDGVYNFNTIRTLTGVQNLTVNINADVTLYGNLQAWYGSGSATNYGGNNVIVNIGKGHTVKANALHSTATTNIAASFGSYTYNINGTLDLSSSSTLSGIIPHATIPESSVTLNVNGVLKTGSLFRTVSSAPGASEGKVTLTIGENGLIDAVKAEAGFTILPNYFIVNGKGALKRAVGSTMVTFPIGTSGGSFSPVSLSNTGTADNFSVTVKNTFDHPVPDSGRVVNKQWSIAEEAAGGSLVTAKFQWPAVDQSPGFDSAQFLAVMQYNNNWNIKAAVYETPNTASVSGLNSFSDFGVTNYTKADPTLYIENARYTYDGNAHATTGFAYGAGGTGDTLSPGLTFIYNNNPEDAGTYTVIALYDGNDYYNPDTATATIIIDPATLTIKANDQGKECGTTLYLGDTAFTALGLISGDTVSSVTLSSAGAPANAKVGTYEIIPSNASGAGLFNYNIIYVNGTLTVRNRITCGKDGDRVLICHKGKTLCISRDAVQAHLKHGDSWGTCDEKQEVRVYPNPARDNLNVQIEHIMADATVQLFTARGLLVRSVRLTSTPQSISVKGLPQGVYLVVIRNGDQITTEKIVVTSYY